MKWKNSCRLYIGNKNGIYLYVNYSLLHSKSTFRATLLEMLGWEVGRISKSSFSKAGMRFNVGHLTSGVYILGIETKDDIIYNKLYIN